MRSHAWRKKKRGVRNRGEADAPGEVFNAAAGDEPAYAADVKEAEEYMESEFLREARRLMRACGLPSWVVEHGCPVDSFRDLVILARISELARNEDESARVWLMTFAGSVDMAPIHVQQRLMLLIADGYVVCEGRMPGGEGVTDGYLLRVAARRPLLPSDRGTGPPRHAA